MEDFSFLSLIPEFGIFGSLVIAGLWAILKGKLVPEKTYKEALKDRDYWRSVALSSVRQNDKLIIGTEVTSNLLTSLPLPDEGGVQNNVDT